MEDLFSLTGQGAAFWSTVAQVAATILLASVIEATLAANAFRRLNFRPGRFLVGFYFAQLFLILIGLFLALEVLSGLAADGYFQRFGAIVALLLSVLTVLMTIALRGLASQRTSAPPSESG